MRTKIALGLSLMFSVTILTNCFAEDSADKSSQKAPQVQTKKQEVKNQPRNKVTPKMLAYYKKWEKDFNTLSRKKVEQICRDVHEHEFRTLYKEWVFFSSGESHDFMTAESLLKICYFYVRRIEERNCSPTIGFCSPNEDAMRMFTYYAFRVRRELCMYENYIAVVEALGKIILRHELALRIPLKDSLVYEKHCMRVWFY